MSEDQDSDESNEAAEVNEEQSQVDPFWKDQDELLGLLLSVNQKLSDAGTGIMGFSFFLYVALAVTLFFDLGSHYDYSLRGYDSWVTYAAGFAVLFVISSYLSGLMEKITYLWQKDRINQALMRRGISTYVLISKIEKSPGLSLKNVANRLKSDV